jgi:hypothetical protein
MQHWVKHIHTAQSTLFRPGKLYWRGRLSTVDLLVLTSLDQLLLIMQTLLSFNKTSFLNEELHCTVPLQLVFPVSTLTYHEWWRYHHWQVIPVLFDFSLWSTQWDQITFWNFVILSHFGLLNTNVKLKLHSQVWPKSRVAIK